MNMSKCKTVRAEVFATLPEEFRKKGLPSSRRAGQRGQPRETHSFLEGPAFGPDGNLYAVDIPFGRIFRISPQGKVELAIEYDGEPTGMKILKSGLACVTDQARGLIQIDFETKEIVPIAARRYSENYRGLNDLCIAQSGAFYFTETGLSDMSDPTGRVYRVDPDKTQHVLIRNGPGPNGVVLSPDENTLFVAMTRSNSIWRCPLMLDGGPTKVSSFINLSGGQGPDGIAIDESGGLAVAHVGLGVVWIFDVKGEPVLRIESPVGDLTTNLVFGGADRRTLYITEAHSGSILAARVDTPGLVRQG